MLPFNSTPFSIYGSGLFDEQSIIGGQAFRQMVDNSYQPYITPANYTQYPVYTPQFFIMRATPPNPDFTPISEVFVTRDVPLSNPLGLIAQQQSEE